MSQSVHPENAQDTANEPRSADGLTGEILSQLGIMYHVLKRAPPTARDQFSEFELDTLHDIVPFIDKAKLQRTLQRLTPQLEIFYNWVVEAMRLSGKTIEDIYRPYVDEEGQRAISEWHQAIDEQNSGSSAI